MQHPAITITSMTPDEYAHGGANLTINYSFAESPFGPVFIASTHKGVCNLEFSNDNTVLNRLQKRFPKAKFCQSADCFQKKALQQLTSNGKIPGKIELHVRGTDFQLKVWNALLHIPAGKPVTYRDIAARIGNDKALRATGTAIGNNPVAVLIPCHRVIPASGAPGNYRWGTELKAALIAREAGQNRDTDTLTL